MEMNLVSGQAGSLVLLAPLSGLVIPLEEVPDPVFAQKLVGDGLAIDPLSETLSSPFAGEVVQIHPACHALTLRHPSGVQVLMHIGLETVQLKGQGFHCLVKVGDQVTAGQPLIQFDADYLAQRVPSLISPIIILADGQSVDFEVTYGLAQQNKPGFLVLRGLRGTGDTQGSETVSESVSVSETVSESESVSETETEAAEANSRARVKIPLETGLHARPASLVVQAAKRFSSQLTLTYAGKTAQCRSLVQLLELAVPHQGEVVITAQGADHRLAVKELQRLLSELQEDAPTSPLRNSTAATAVMTHENRLGGVVAAPGIVAGRIYVYQPQSLTPPEYGEASAKEHQRLFVGLQSVAQDLQTLQQQVKASAGAGQAAIFAAHLDILEDPALLSAIEDLIHQGKSAAWAVNAVFSHEVARLEKVANELIAARANDLKDVGRRLVAQLMESTPEIPQLPPQTILVAEDLTPSDTAALDRNQVVGFCTLKGGSSSHVAILARSLGLPALAAIDARAFNLSDGETVILNANEGYLQLKPSSQELEALAQLNQNLEVQRQAEERAAQQTAMTQDGTQILVFANFASHQEAERGRTLGAEGVGLMRSEFLFLNRQTAPSEEEQYQIYSHITQCLGPDRPVIIRALDVGGDKPLAYCPLPAEDNPFLGERGLRLLLREQQLFRTQVRALLRAHQHGPIRLMLPMVTNLDEVQAARAMVREEQESLGVPALPLGIMIEVPAAALMADQLAREVDFFSIGTNDLTQYALAMDRNHPSLARHVDGLHPAVLKLIQQTVTAAHRAEIEVGICGGIAGDASGVPILIGLGLRELSVSLPSVPGIKARVRDLHLAHCERVAEQALGMTSAQQVRDLIKREFPKRN